LATADDVIVLLPSLRVDGLANGAKDSDRAEVVAIDVVSAETAEESNNGGSRIELAETVCFWRVAVTPFESGP
jgi:hypothetical protein